MNERRLARPMAYGMAVLAVLGSLLVRLPLVPWLGYHAELMTFFPAIILSAYLGGLGPGLLATVLGVVAADYFFIEPRYSFGTDDPGRAFAMGLFALAGAVFSGLMESVDRSRRRLAASERRYAVTLASIGDAIIATDTWAKVTLLNPVAEALTGWPLADAVGRPLAEVFRIVHEQTRQSVEDPAAKVLRLGTVVGLANHTALIARDGREVSIDDCGAPIIDDRGAIAGVVLVFRDVTPRRQAEEAAAFRRANERMEQALSGSSVGMWEVAMPDGDLQNGRRYYLNLWEQLGYDPYPGDEVVSPFETRPAEPTQPPFTAISTGQPPWESALGLQIHPEDLDRFQERVRRYLAGETSEYETEVRLRHKDGSYRTVLWRGTAVRDAAGKPIRFVGVTVDITQLKLAEEELRRTAQLLQAVADGTQDAVYVKDRGGRHLMFNAAASRMVGKPIGEVLGRDDTAIFEPDSARAVMAHDRKVMESGLAETDEKALTAGGVTRSYLAAKAPYRDGHGNVIGLIGICHDITERRCAEEALCQANARVELAVRSSNICIWECDMPDGRIENAHLTLINVWESLGYDARTSPTDFSSACAVFFHPDDLERVGREIQELLASDGHEWKNEYRALRKDGSTRWHLARGTVMRDPEGKPVRFIGTSADITDLKRAEEALRESEERFRGTFENAAVGIAHTHPTGRFLRVNETFCTIVGYPREELLQKGFQDITHPDDLAANINLLAGLIRGDSPGYATEKRYLRKDGSPIWAELFASLQRDAAGQPAYAIAVIQNISERKRLEGELRQAKEAAEAANRAKDEFLANVSHEIRTPMNAIIGMTELVLDTPLAEDQRQGLKTVKSAADSLLGIINDLLDFSRIEAGKLELVPADFSLRGAVGDTLRTLAVRAHKKGLELIYQVQPDVPDALVGDVGRLRQVLLNLAGNAVKFTDEGEVVVRVEIEGDGTPPPPGAGEVRVRFTVRDTGIGIPPDQQERIFRAFEQEDTSTTRKYGGTGLGLTIATRLVAFMGGTITVDSVPGRGSTFAFTARLGRQPHPSEPVAARPPVPLHDLPVLVVDDNATNRHILAEWLRGWQMDSTAVGDGMAAMDALWHRAANGRPYALVLLDARMPDTDGLAVVAMIRERAELAATRIILLTSGERPGDLARSRDLRIDAQLLKPVQQDELLETIYRVMSRSRGNAPLLAWSAPRQHASTAPVPAATPLHILVAEDNELSAQVLEQSLVREGHRVRLASNRREALTLAEQGGVDLLLLDVHMPELDGFQVVQAVREREQSAGGHLPIIALTARSRKEDRERCLASGMDDFLAKPIRPADLIVAIDRVLGAHSPPKTCSLDLLDAPVLLAACGGDPTLFRKMCQTLTARVPEHLAALRDALRDQDAPRLREAAHKCCGMLSEFSAAAGDLAGSLEELAAGSHLDGAAAILEQLQTMAPELVKQVDGITVAALRHRAEGMDEPDGTAGP